MSSNAEFLDAYVPLLADLIAGEITPEAFEASALPLYEAWMLGGASLSQVARLATEQTSLAGQMIALFADWQSGTATGGPNGDGLYPLRTADGGEYLVASPAKIASAAVTITPRGTVANATALNALTGVSAGDLYVVASPTPAHSWVRNKANTAWVDMGVWAGPTGVTGTSAKQAVINAGELASGASDADFATWLANAQIAAVQTAVQPLVDDAGAAVVATAADRVQTGADRTAAESAKDDAEAAAATATTKADDASADALATAADRVQTGADRTAAESAKDDAEAAAATATTKADDASADALATAADRVQTGADRTAAESAKDDAEAAAATATTKADDASADALATAADRVQTGADRTAAESAKDDAEAAAATATTKADDASADALATAADRVQTGADRTAAESAKDDAEAAAATATTKADDASADAIATAADRVQTGADRTAAESAKDDAEAAAATATTKADETAADALATAADRVQTGLDRAAAEAARDEAAQIVGGDFVTGPESSVVGYVPTFNTTSGKALDGGRAIGAASSTDLLDRAAGDGRYRAAGAVAQSDVTGLSGALDAKAPLADPAFTGNPTAVTQEAGNSSTRLATTAFVTAAFQALVGMAPSDLDTLAEIAARLADNEDTDADNYAALVSLIGDKLAKASNLSDLTDVAAARSNLGLAALAVLATVGTAQIDADAVTFAKVQNIATARLLGRTTAGSGDVEELTAEAVKNFLAIAAADIAGLAVKAAGSDLRTLTDDAKFLTAKSVKDALAGETLSLSTPDLSRPVQSVTLSANSTLGAPTNVTPGTNGVLYVKQAASGGPYTLGYHTNWKPFGSTPSMPTTAGAVVAIMWTVDGSSVVRFAMTQAAAS